MKVAILAGGVGTRLVGVEVKPKPMVEIGGRPILWHIMMHYAHYGFKRFVVALGYEGEVIKEYVVDCCSLNSNLTVNLQTGDVEILRPGRGGSTARSLFLNRACSTTSRATTRSGKGNRWPGW